MLRKNVKEILLFYFLSLKKATFDGVELKLIGWVKKIIKKVKIEMRREGKEVDFKCGTYSLKKISIHMFFTWYLKTIFSMKNEFRFSKQNTHKLKDLELFKVLWTTY